MSKERHESFKLDNFLNKMIEALRTTVSNTIKISPVEAHSCRNMNLTPAQDTFSNISAKSNWIKLNRKTSVLTRKYWADHYCQRRKKETRCDSGIKRERSWLNPQTRKNLLFVVFIQNIDEPTSNPVIRYDLHISILPVKWSDGRKRALRVNKI